MYSRSKTSTISAGGRHSVWQTPSGKEGLRTTSLHYREDRNGIRHAASWPWVLTKKRHEGVGSWVSSRRCTLTAMVTSETLDSEQHHLYADETSESYVILKGFKIQEPDVKSSIGRILELMTML